MSLSLRIYSPANRGGGAVICLVVRINTILGDPGVASPRDDAIFSGESFNIFRGEELLGTFSDRASSRRDRIPSCWFVSAENIASSRLAAPLDESTLAKILNSFRVQEVYWSRISKLVLLTSQKYE